MSLRVRMGLAAGVAVAVAVVAVAFSAYAGTRSQLVGQLDSQLHSLIRPILVNAGVVKPPPGFRANPSEGGDSGGNGQTEPGGQDSESSGQPAGGAGAGVAHDCDHHLGLDLARGGGFGGAQGYVQLVYPTGGVCLSSGETTKLPLTPQIRALARSGHGSLISQTQIGSRPLRVLTVGLHRRGAVEIALNQANINDALKHEAILLIAIAGAGVALAALLAVLVARTALLPIARFTRQTELIAANPQRLDDERLQVSGSDELARLAHTFNDTLDALSASVQAQRNLVADASHELRTPISTIRANLQLMRDEERLTAEDRAALRRDVIDELDELTALVSDVVELARGGTMTGDPSEVRVDEIVAAAVQRAARRHPALQIEAELEPTLVVGDGDRISRAASNLLDNAAKYASSGRIVEVTLQHGTLTVRDHGPGFAEEDLPHVFDRFHRARTARGKPGSGLGLAIVRQAAEAHGGSVEAANAPGGGAMIRISFGPTLRLEESAPHRAASGAGQA
jgi:two-component system sensor histidine kinase MprB